MCSPSGETNKQILLATGEWGDRDTRWVDWYNFRLHILLLLLHRSSHPRCPTQSLGQMQRLPKGPPVSRRMSSPGLWVMARRCLGQLCALGMSVVHGLLSAVPCCRDTHQSVQCQTLPVRSGSGDCGQTSVGSLTGSSRASKC